MDRIRPFRRKDTEPVVDLWHRCGLTRPWNDPRRAIERKLAVQPELFLVVERDGDVVATAMAGYDGHRGWVRAHGAGSDAPRMRRGGRATGSTSPWNPRSRAPASGAP